MQTLWWTRLPMLARKTAVNIGQYLAKFEPNTKWEVYFETPCSRSKTTSFLFNGAEM